MALRVFDIDNDTQIAWRMSSDGQMFCSIFIDNEKAHKDSPDSDYVVVEPIEWPIMLRLAAAILCMEYEYNYDNTSYRPENWDEIKARMKKYLGVVE